MELRVDCRLSPAGERTPQVVWFGSRPVAVQAVVDRWYGREHQWWKVDTAEGAYILREDAEGAWDLAAVPHA
ncbi:MAG TPA: hypothetical protein VFE82_09815 [Ramlibacter sp.]|jgi:hypothetical protein|uniref:hypothetical protein n=1 Tax=Ramlibacter sp. TaxID=1917967 RepID=UPI002D40082C|nr:hypothetical protein [Ramlibacter sp.]HZY18769.1 hypothetical protein [Ramlibacter sp.]